MDDIIIREILARIDQMAALAGSGASSFWPIMVKQQLVYGAQALMWAVAWVVMAGVGASQIHHLVNKAAEDQHNHTTTHDYLSGWWVPVGIAGGAIAFGCIAAAGSVSAALPHFINPEYQAVMDLVKLVRGGK